MPTPSDTKVFECENGIRYLLPANHCVFCAHCTDIFYDHGGPYMCICSEGDGDYRNCSKFKPDEPDPDLIKVVRCQKCKHCDYVQSNGVAHCKRKGAHEFREADDFCKYGERRDDDE